MLKADLMPSTISDLAAFSAWESVPQWQHALRSTGSRYSVSKWNCASRLLRLWPTRRGARESRWYRHPWICRFTRWPKPPPYELRQANSLVEGSSPSLSRNSERLCTVKIRRSSQAGIGQKGHGDSRAAKALTVPFKSKVLDVQVKRRV
jgi:hypothetical protein